MRRFAMRFQNPSIAQIGFDSLKNHFMQLNTNHATRPFGYSQPPNRSWNHILKNFFWSILLNIFHFSLLRYTHWLRFFLNGWHYILGEQRPTDRKYRFWLSQSTSYSFLLQLPIPVYFSLTNNPYLLFDNPYLLFSIQHHIASRQRCHPHLGSGLWSQFWSKLTLLDPYKYFIKMEIAEKPTPPK